MSDQDFWIPRTLDAPPMIFFWEADTAVIAIFWLVIGGLMAMPILGLVLAVICCKGYAYMKEEGGRGLIVRILYWYTPSGQWLSKRFPSHVREYFGS